MNLQEADILKTLVTEPFINQRVLSEITGHSLGVVNRSLRRLTADGYLDGHSRLTEKARTEIESCAPRNAIILAAGFGMRMVPINLSVPKALLEVNGEKLIERLIRQLHEAGITDITVVAGFMKESFEYLIDEFGIELLINPDYASRNNLHSLRLAADRISNTYIVPCDIRAQYNPFSRTELYSWYMVSDKADEDSSVRVNRKMELAIVPEHKAGNAMIGIAYLTGETAKSVQKKLAEYDADSRYAGAFWEETLYRKDRMILQAKVAPGADVIEINTYEQLREMDAGSNHLKSDAIETIAGVLHCRENEIRNITVLKKGMTNRSFLFTVSEKKYIMRIPGEGTNRLIDRGQEAEVYHAISGRGICDDPVYLDPKKGYKITRYLEGVRTCSSDDPNDLKRCMSKLKQFHGMRILVQHTFDLFGQIEFYESLWEGNPSVYRDYGKTKEKVFALKPFIESRNKEMCLTHIDAVPDNFLFYTPAGGTEEELQLTDWEYAGMQDPHVDIAMFCIYSLYTKKQCDRLIDIYFDGACDTMTRAKIYAYISVCGLLWSNWCEYKRKLGVEFGEYSIRQYRFAKDYYRYAAELAGMTASEEPKDAAEVENA